MTFWKTPSFKALQKAWYQRLEEEGFHDAEELIEGELLLKQWTPPAFRHKNRDPVIRITKASYFSMLGEFIQNGEFHNEVDKIILTMFADGARHKHIVEALELMGLRRDRNTVRYVIRKYEMRWGLREYTSKQLNKKEAS